MAHLLLLFCLLAKSILPFNSECPLICWSNLTKKKEGLDGSAACFTFTQKLQDNCCRGIRDNWPLGPGAPDCKAGWQSVLVSSFTSRTDSWQRIISVYLGARRTILLSLSLVPSILLLYCPLSLQENRVHPTQNGFLTPMFCIPLPFPGLVASASPLVNDSMILNQFE